MSTLRYFGQSGPPGKKRKEMTVEVLDDSDSGDSDISPAINGACDRALDSHSESSFCSTNLRSSTSKQSTQFNTDWLVGRSSLRYTEVGMTCVLCVKHKQCSFNNDVWTSREFVYKAS
jgi:hypothetical protein